MELKVFLSSKYDSRSENHLIDINSLLYEGNRQ